MIEVLLQRPKGMRLSVIVANIYNMNAGLFSSPELYDTIHQQVYSFLYRESKKKKSAFIRVPGRWGYYAIKRSYARQLKLQFSDTPLLPTTTPAHN